MKISYAGSQSVNTLASDCFRRFLEKNA